jgi:peptidylprolyl isomerase
LPPPSPKIEPPKVDFGFASSPHQDNNKELIKPLVSKWSQKSNSLLFDGTALQSAGGNSANLFQTPQQQQQQQQQQQEPPPPKSTIFGNNNNNNNISIVVPGPGSSGGDSNGSSSTTSNKTPLPFTSPLPPASSSPNPNPPTSTKAPTPFGGGQTKAAASATSSSSYPPSSSKAPTPFGGATASSYHPPSSATAPTPFGTGQNKSTSSYPPTSTKAPTPFGGAGDSTSDDAPINDVDYKAQLIDFYKKYNPEKLDTVDSTLAKYKGKEKELFQKLQEKYTGSKFPLPGGDGPQCYLKFSVGDKPVGKVVVKLYKDNAPLAAENFRCLCTGGKGMGKSGKPLCYKGSKIHRIIPSFCVQMGDFTKGDGTGGESIYPAYSEHGDAWGKFKDEGFMQHSKAGLLSMANSGENTNQSQVFFTLKAVPHLDGKHVVFGEVVQGMDVVELLGKVETNAKQVPVEQVVILDCGEIVNGEEFPCQPAQSSGPFGLSSTGNPLFGSSTGSFSFGGGASPFGGTSSTGGGFGSTFGSSSQTTSTPFGTTSNLSTNSSPFSFGSTPAFGVPPSSSQQRSNTQPSFGPLGSNKS